MIFFRLNFFLPFFSVKNDGKKQVNKKICLRLKKLSTDKNKKLSAIKKTKNCLRLKKQKTIYDYKQKINHSYFPKLKCNFFAKISEYGKHFKILESLVNFCI